MGKTMMSKPCIKTMCKTMGRYVHHPWLHPPSLGLPNHYLVHIKIRWVKPPCPKTMWKTMGKYAHHPWVRPPSLDPPNHYLVHIKKITKLPPICILHCTEYNVITCQVNCKKNITRTQHLILLLLLL